MMKELDFEVIRVRGSHHFLSRMSDGKTTVVSIHGNDEISRGLLRTILRDIEISVEEYEKLRVM